MNYIDRIISLDACRDAVGWLHEANHPTPEAAWAACPRADWMLWLLSLSGADRKKLVFCTCDIAETALIHVPVGADQPQTAIETARRWARGEASIEEVQSAAADAYKTYTSYISAIHEAHASCAPNAAAAHAAAYAAYAACAAGDTTHDDDAAHASAIHAFTAHTCVNAAHASVGPEANIVRRHFPYPPKLPGVSL